MLGNSQGHRERERGGERKTRTEGRTERDKGTVEDVFASNSRGFYMGVYLDSSSLSPTILYKMQLLFHSVCKVFFFFFFFLDKIKYLKAKVSFIFKSNASWICLL